MVLLKRLRQDWLLLGVGFVVVAVWGVISLPKIASATCGRTCSHPWDCNTACDCTNMQVDPGWPMDFRCVHACNQQTQTVSKNQCADAAPGLTCPAETSKKCGTAKTKTEARNAKNGRGGCESGDYATFTDCTADTTTDVSSMACD